MLTAHFADIVGFLASSLSFVLWLPQAHRAWKARRNPSALGAISVATQGLLFLSATLWGLYGIVLHAFWVGAPGLINGPLALLTIIIVLRSKRAKGGALTERSL